MRYSWKTTFNQLLKWYQKSYKILQIAKKDSNPADLKGSRISQRKFRSIGESLETLELMLRMSTRRRHRIKLWDRITRFKRFSS